MQLAEISGVTWSTSAANADAIRRVIQDNYGHAGIAFVSYLSESGLDMIEQKWEEWTTCFIEALPENNHLNTKNKFLKSLGKTDEKQPKWLES